MTKLAEYYNFNMFLLDLGSAHCLITKVFHSCLHVMSQHFVFLYSLLIIMISSSFANTYITILIIFISENSYILVVYVLSKLIIIKIIFVIR